MTVPRCPWSDLPTHSCDHCHPDTTPVGITKPVAPPAVAHPVAVQPPPTKQPRPRSLPEDTRHWLLADYITALTDTTRTGQPFQTSRRNPDGTLTWITERHYTTSPPLLEQLWSAAEQSGSAEGGRRAFGSKPSARIDALDVAMRIEQEVHAQLTVYGVADSHDHYANTLAAVRHLGSLALEDRDVFRLVRSWWSAARVVTGWDSPAWAPNSGCPLCASRGSLRIRLDLHTAVCVGCHETWSPETIGLLADHIRAEGEAGTVDEETPAVRGLA
jgi:hypothetical protein